MKKEDYNIIAPDNKVWDFQEWMINPDMVNDVSENPYPVMYVEGKAVYEGDKLIFNGDDNGDPYQTLREVKWQHRALINGNKDWIKNWSYGKVIGRVNATHKEEGYANLKLITKAPQMLRAMNELVLELDKINYLLPRENEDGGNLIWDRIQTCRSIVKNVLK